MSSSTCRPVRRRSSTGASRSAPTSTWPASALRPRATHRPGTFDVVAPITVVPEHGSGFVRPTGPHRPARSEAAPGRHVSRRSHVDSSATAARSSKRPTRSPDSHLRTLVTARRDAAHLGRAHQHRERRYSLDGLTVTLPIPRARRRAADLRGPVVARVPSGPHATGTRANCSSRTGAVAHRTSRRRCSSPASRDSTSGTARSAASTWRGAATTRCSPSGFPTGAATSRPANCSTPARSCSNRASRIATPDVLGCPLAEGLTAATWQFHRAVRAAPDHPTSAPPGAAQHVGGGLLRPRHRRSCKALADAAADLGIERFVLDDGWFGSRRDDTRGLGDWWVVRAVYPDGLEPLIAHVTGLGMEFGIWVEPEMVNPDSDLFRAHPDWALTDPRVRARARPHSSSCSTSATPTPSPSSSRPPRRAAQRPRHLLRQMGHEPRPHPGQRCGRRRAAPTRQTLAVYRLLDELRAKHPTVEFESCASGGGRIDHEILRRTERVWTSDCNDALERQTIQRGASMLIPPEVMGAHIGPDAVAHHRAHPHAVVPCRHRAVRAPRRRVERLDARRPGPDRPAGRDRDVPGVPGAVAPRRHRAIRHRSGVQRARRLRARSFGGDRVLRAARPPRPARRRRRCGCRGSISMPTTASSTSRFPSNGGVPHALSRRGWHDGITLSARQLASHGVQPPTLHPESALLFKLTRLS